MSETATHTAAHTLTDPALETCWQNQQAAEQAILSRIEPQDWALVVQIDSRGSSLLEPILAAFDDRILRVPDAFETALGDALRRPIQSSEQAQKWEQICAEIATGVGRLASDARGRIHIFPMCPHHSALFLGHQLQKHLRNSSIFVHHRQQPARYWVPFLALHSSPQTRRAEFFNSPERLSRPGGYGYGISIELRRRNDPGYDDKLKPTETALGLAMQEQGLSDIQRIWPRSGSVIESPAQADAAYHDLIRLLDSSQRSHPREPLHVFTGAPVALMVAMGYQLSGTVYHRVIAYHYDSAKAGRDVGSPSSASEKRRVSAYFPALDVISGRPLGSGRSRLEVLHGEGGIFYRLDGETLLACCRVPEEKQVFNGSAPTKSDIAVQSQQLQKNFLPATVVDRIRSLERLDIEIGLEGNASAIAWEYLPHGDSSFAVLQPDWTLYRRVKAEGQTRNRARSTGKNGSHLTLLVTPMYATLDKNRSDFDAAVAEICKNARQSGIHVVLLPVETTLDELHDALTQESPDILLWIGHGDGEDSKGDWLGVLGANHARIRRALDRSQVLHVFDDGFPPPLVILAACKVGRTPTEFGVIPGFIDRGVGAVLAFRASVTGPEVQTFCSALLQSLGRGDSVGEATRLGRRALNLGAAPAERTENTTDDLILAGAFGFPVLTCADPRALDPLLYLTTVPPVPGADLAHGQEGPTVAPHARRGELPLGVDTHGKDNLTQVAETMRENPHATPEIPARDATSESHPAASGELSSVDGVRPRRGELNLGSDTKGKDNQDDRTRSLSARMVQEDLALTPAEQAAAYTPEEEVL